MMSSVLLEICCGSADDVIESPNSLVIPEAANREISCSVVIKRMLEAL